jgi:ribosome-binding protein aMBF1 (putative translation factor)
LRECIDILGWTQRGLARTLERQEGTVRQWARGVVQIPDDVDVWLEKLVKAHERNPAPRREETTTDPRTRALAAEALARKERI